MQGATVSQFKQFSPLLSFTLNPFQPINWFEEWKKMIIYNFCFSFLFLFSRLSTLPFTNWPHKYDINTVYIYILGCYLHLHEKKSTDNSSSSKMQWHEIKSNITCWFHASSEYECGNRCSLSWKLNSFAYYVYALQSAESYVPAVREYISHKCLKSRNL